MAGVHREPGWSPSVCRTLIIAAACLVLPLAASLGRQPFQPPGLDPTTGGDPPPPLAPGLTVQAFQDGSYTVLVQGQPWLMSGPTFLHAGNRLRTTADGSLRLCGTPVRTAGIDALGSWIMVGLEYRLANSSPCIMNITIKSYSTSNVVIFSQSFPRGLHNSSTGQLNAVVTSFPAFSVPAVSDMGLLAFGGVFTYQKLAAQRFKQGLRLAGAMETGPLVLFSRTGPALVLSAFSEFMATSVWHNETGHTLHWGIMGKAAHVPPNFSSQTILYYSPNGVNTAMSGWGEVLRSWYHKDVSLPQQDLSVSHLGYYTDNGGYYYHHLGKPFSNYEQMLIGITKNARRQNIPYKYLQYDDWWYYIRGPGYGATVRWEPLPDVFPHGLEYLHNRTRLPVVAHNRFWSSTTPYAKQNGGKFNFLTYQRLAIPNDQAFWDWLFSGARGWGMVTYEQDWLNYQTERILPLHTDVRLAAKWLKQMGDAASHHNITLQYCMALPRHLLYALQVPAVTQARMSSDYHTDIDQWRVGITSMLAAALGLVPFKDTFWTRQSEPGNPYNKTEPSPFLEAVVSLLTTGPVAPSDGYRMVDPHLLARLHRADGLLLKPGRPAMAIDAQIHEMAFHDGSGPQGEVWVASTTLGGLTFGILLAAALSAPYSIRPSQAGFSREVPELMAFPFMEGAFPKLQEWSDARPLTLAHCNTSAPCLWYITPVITLQKYRVMLLGELDKIVPMSPQRVVMVTVTQDDVRVTVSGVAEEKIRFSIITDAGPSTISCTALGSDGRAVVSVREGRCYPSTESNTRFNML